jgi:hypothetical protein
MLVNNLWPLILLETHFISVLDKVISKKFSKCIYAITHKDTIYKIFVTGVRIKTATHTKLHKALIYIYIYIYMCIYIHMYRV